MNESHGNIAYYNEPLNFTVKFTAPDPKNIYQCFIIEEKLHRSLTFNFKNSYIKADGEIIIGTFQYDDSNKFLRIEIENPSFEKNSEIEITIATNITDLSAVIESNYIINNMAYIKIKGYENVDGLTTKSNLITINFSSIKIDISAYAISTIVPAIDGERIIVEASFNTLDTDASYDILIKNILGENLLFDDMQSYACIDGKKIDLLQFIEEDKCVKINFHNCSEIKNKVIQVRVCAKIQNAINMSDALISEFILNINNVDCSKDAVEIPLIKPISWITNTLISDT